jgi:hypothetical protein
LKTIFRNSENGFFLSLKSLKLIVIN